MALDLFCFLKFCDHGCCAAVRQIYIDHQVFNILINVNKRQTLSYDCIISMNSISLCLGNIEFTGFGQYVKAEDCSYM